MRIEGLSMPLQDLCVLVMIADAADASELVRYVERAGGDVVAAANPFEALQRLRQFVFHAAVVDCSGGAETVVAARPDVLNHNLETVPRLYAEVRPGARYFHSLRLLDQVTRIVGRAHFEADPSRIDGDCK